MTTRWIPTAIAFVVAALGGLHSVLFSCGGYVWHRHAFWAALFLITLVALLLPLRRRRPLASRTALVLGVPATYLLLEALAAPFYPGPPASWSEFLSVFLMTLERGPC